MILSIILLYYFSQAKEEQTIASVLAQMPAEKRPKLKQHLHTLRTIVQECMGYEEAPEVVEHASLFLFWLLLEQCVVTVASTMRIRSIFGTIFGNKLACIHQCIGDIRKLLEDYEIEELRQWNKMLSVKRHQETSMWGENIQLDRLKFNIVQNQLPDYGQLNDWTPLVHSTSVENVSIIEDINNKSVNDNYQQKFSATCINLADKLTKISNEMDLKQIIDNVSELLNSKKTNNELQNDLIELLGFEHFDLVQELLTERSNVAIYLANSLCKNDTKKKLQKLRNKNIGTNNSNRTITGNGSGNSPIIRPTVATAVVVQSFQEKELSKQQRRDEKKLQRLLHSIERSENKKDEDTSQLITPLQLQLEEQRRMLETVQHEPILHSTKSFKEFYTTMKSQPKIKYPFVFDSQLEAKQHAGFIGGSRISLPASTIRLDNRQYEEVLILANDPPPNIEADYKRIEISELDEIGQIAFANCKRLNLIQSIVFPVAYHSNENMLVCAPTGAGKTNVAMLTIVHTIRINLEDGIINRDQFKIVYIAPMKALAAEMAENFSKRLKELKINVRELTGDMQLTKTEMSQTQILVTTPEKWDVVTRKGRILNKFDNNRIVIMKPNEYSC